MSDAAPRSLKLVRHEANFMAPLDQALGKLVAVSFDSSEFREGKVGADKDAVSLFVLPQTAGPAPV